MVTRHFIRSLAAQHLLRSTNGPVADIIGPGNFDQHLSGLTTSDGSLRQFVLSKSIVLPLPDAHCVAVIARPGGPAVLLECEALIVGEAKDDDIILGCLKK